MTSFTLDLGPLVEREQPVIGDNFNLLVGEDANAEMVEPLRYGLDPQLSWRRNGVGWVGVDVTLVDALPLAPTDALFETWRSRLLDEPVIDDNDAIARAIFKTRDNSTLNIRELGGAVTGHPEDLDFSIASNVQEKFFYLHDLLHCRRINQIADVVVDKARRAIETKNSAVVFEIGPGPGAVQRAASTRLSNEERKMIRFVAVDVSIDLLKYGVGSGWFDEGILADISTFDVNEMEAALGHPDVIVACEILEHIESSASVVDRGLIEWARRSGAWLIGSVPNAMQGSEMIGLFRGERASHQLSRHLFDETTDHVAFYTYPTLRTALVDFWKAEEPCIWGNGLRLDEKGQALCLDGGLWYPHRSDRLCFAGKF